MLIIELMMHLIPMVNIVNVDAQFNLGDSTKPIKNNSFVGKIILDEAL